MKRIIAVLALSVGLCAYADPQPEPGFATFSWGSTYEYVLAENREEGHEPFEQLDGWLWYTGQLGECATKYGYRFVDNQLDSGLVYIENSDPHCDEVTFDFLSEYAGQPIRLTVESDGWWISIFRVTP